MAGAQIAIDRLQFDRALHHIARATEAAERSGLKRFVARNLGHKANVSLQQGSHAEAAKLARQAAALSLETGPGYCGPANLAVLVRATDDPDEAARAIEEAEAMLAAGAVSHNFFEFYIAMIEHYLRQADWDGVERCCQILEEYTHGEPLPRTDYFIARGRALASFGRGQREKTLMRELQRLRDEGERVGLAIALSSIDKALNGF